MSLLTASIIIISQSDQKFLNHRNLPESEDIVVTSMWFPIDMVILYSVVHSIVTTISRYWTIHGGIPSSELQLDAFFCHSISLIFL